MGTRPQRIHPYVASVSENWTEAILSEASEIFLGIAWQIKMGSEIFSV